MNKTTENILVCGSLGAGLGLLLSGHWRWGLAAAAVAPTTYATAHPRATWGVVKRASETVAAAGKTAGIAVAKAGEVVGKSAAEIGKGLKSA